MMASPTAASAAATAITKNTKTCPPTPIRCASATKVKLTALSISSTHMKITIALRRSSTPATPSANSTAEIASAGLSSMLQLPFCEHDGAHDRGEQQHARDLERNEVDLEQRAGYGADHALLLLRRGDGAGRKLNGVGQCCATEHPELKQQRSREHGRGQESGGSFDISPPGAPRGQQPADGGKQDQDGAGGGRHPQRRRGMGGAQGEGG